VHADGKRSYRLALAVVCSSGTFIRVIGPDLAEALGTKAVMESLVRTAVGRFTLARALPLGAITPASCARRLSKRASDHVSLVVDFHLR
jgi:tRNA U55 pseudouridine synthase TruB